MLKPQYINVPLYILNNKMQYSLFLFIALSNAIQCMINQKKKKRTDSADKHTDVPDEVTLTIVR